MRPRPKTRLLSLALYRAWARVGLSAFAPKGAALTLILIGLGTGGCSFSRGDGPFAKMSRE